MEKDKFSSIHQPVSSIYPLQYDDIVFVAGDDTTLHTLLAALLALLHSGMMNLLRNSVKTEETGSPRVFYKPHTFHHIFTNTRPSLRASVAVFHRCTLALLDRGNPTDCEACRK